MEKWRSIDIQRFAQSKVVLHRIQRDFHSTSWNRCHFWILSAASIVFTLIIFYVCICKINKKIFFPFFLKIAIYQKCEKILFCFVVCMYTYDSDDSSQFLEYSRPLVLLLYKKTTAALQLVRTGNRLDFRIIIHI